ncbi:MAG: hypothetical protein WB607_23165 [Candidatus Acidiferrum sp.]|jgi:hypothetical protein
MADGPARLPWRKRLLLFTISGIAFLLLFVVSIRITVRERFCVSVVLGYGLPLLFWLAALFFPLRAIRWRFHRRTAAAVGAWVWCGFFGSVL